MHTYGKEKTGLTVEEVHRTYTKEPHGKEQGRKQKTLPPLTCSLTNAIK